MTFVRYRVGDVVEMKKPHPCGSKEWEVIRVGADIGIRCCGCSHRILLSREKFEKSVKKRISSVEEQEKSGD